MNLLRGIKYIILIDTEHKGLNGENYKRAETHGFKMAEPV
jgi:hypothetical protein